MYYKLTIDETGRNTLKEEPRRFNQEVTTHKELGDVLVYLMQRYGKMPTRTEANTIYRDTETGTEAVGFLHSYWNKDISHGGKSWYQTDWVVITQVNETAVVLN